MAISRCNNGSQTVTVSSENLIDCNLEIPISPSTKHNYICQSTLAQDCLILGFPSGDCINSEYAEILGVVYLAVKETKICFHVVQISFSENCRVTPGILGIKGVLESGITDHDHTNHTNPK